MKLIVLATLPRQNFRFHGEIVENFQKEAQDLFVNCIGGGFMSIDTEAKSIKVWGESGQYGKEPERQQTVAILKTKFPDFSVTAS